jgi:hypothetical protein
MKLDSSTDTLRFEVGCDDCDWQPSNYAHAKIAAAAHAHRTGHTTAVTEEIKYVWQPASGVS